MAVTTTITLEDIGAVTALELAAHRGEDMTDLMDQIGMVLVAGAVERIGMTNVSPDGVPWPQSLRVRIGAQAARPEGSFVGPMPDGGGGPTLHLSGRLMRSITHLPAPREVEIGSNLIYAGVHQAGATIRAKTAEGLSFTLANGDHVVVGAVTIPARPYLGISAEEADEIEGLAAVHFGEPLGAD